MNKQITIIFGVLVKDGKILMQQRFEKEQPDAHLKWEFPGGKVEFNETPQQAIEREFLEETGVKVKAKKVFPYAQTSYWEYGWGTQQTLCFGFWCEYVDELSTKKNDHRVIKIEWFSKEEALALPSLPGTKEVLALLWLQ